MAVRVGVLACTLTIPPGTGRRTAVAFAHGGGPALRTFVAFQAAHLQRLGLITLACDKRGIGQSGGRYPGDLATSPTIDALARDVEAQARFLAAQPEVDPARVGVMGGSQAGWVMPLAASREPAIRFVVGLVPPTVTQGETDLFAQLSGQGQSPPTRTEAEVLAEVRAAGPSGFDPLPSIRALRIPALWLFGGVDKVVPTRLCVERLEPVAREPGRDFTYAVFPGGGHGLVQTANGLLAEQDRSDRFVPGLHTTIADWLRARGLRLSVVPVAARPRMSLSGAARCETHEQRGRCRQRDVGLDGHRVAVVAGAVDAALDHKAVTLVEGLRILVRLCDKEDVLPAGR